MTALIIGVFIVGYLVIVLEQPLHLNKAAAALITGVLCWTIYILHAGEPHVVNEHLVGHLGRIAEVLFFLLGAMTIVELIDTHDGFEVITSRIKTTDKRKLMWLLCGIAFFLSAILDNLTTAIVMVSLVKKLVKDKQLRLLYSGLIVVAANSGGAWSPIGDVTTTMLWISGQVSSLSLIKHLILPSMVSLAVPLIVAGTQISGRLELASPDSFPDKPLAPERERKIVLFSGLIILLCVPVFKTLTHLPPYMGMLLGLGVIWVVTELIHKGKKEEVKSFYSVMNAIRKVDTPSILFFLGILISVAALESIGVLNEAAGLLDRYIGNKTIIVTVIGLLSAIVDNVPLVAASMGMYAMDRFPTDDAFWHLLAFCAGTGGSLLVIGSAAGVAAMGIEKIEFFWYVRKIAWLALLGYVSGILVFLALQSI